MARRDQRSSQQLWTEGEAQERGGDTRKALDLFVQAALVEEEGRRPLRALLLWEQIAQRTGATGTVLERLARASEGGRLLDEAFDYWAAACAMYDAEGKTDDAARARDHALRLKAKVGPHDRPALAAGVLEREAARVADLLAG